MECHAVENQAVNVAALCLAATATPVLTGNGRERIASPPLIMLGNATVRQTEMENLTR